MSPQGKNVNLRGLSMPDSAFLAAGACGATAVPARCMLPLMHRAHTYHRHGCTMINPVHGFALVSGASGHTHPATDAATGDHASRGSCTPATRLAPQPPPSQATAGRTRGQPMKACDRVSSWATQQLAEQQTVSCSSAACCLPCTRGPLLHDAAATHAAAATQTAESIYLT
jgi:hypothetical protein